VRELLEIDSHDCGWTCDLTGWDQERRNRGSW
jgi:hypothetical protein